jgi:hypothetical protein
MWDCAILDEYFLDMLFSCWNSVEQKIRGAILYPAGTCP